MRMDQFNKSLLAMTATIAFLVPMAAFAQSAKGSSAPAASSAGGDKLDVSDLEKKYWASKDTDFNVVQNRVYTKANRFAVTAEYGSMINDAWSDGPTYDLNVGYFWSDRWGAELSFSKSNTTDNSAASQLISQKGYPNNDKMKNFYGAQVDWVPIYAKMSFLNSSIIYFDMGISLGAGVTSYEQQKEEGNVMQNAPTVTLDVTQQFFLSKHFAIRLDYKNHFYQQDVLWYHANSVPAGGSRTNTTELNHTTILMGGVSYYF